MKGLKTLGKILIWTVLIIIGLLAVAFLTLKINSPGKMPAIKNSAGKEFPNGISEKVYVNINGVEQGMFIRGESADKPVLLFLHGGPGSPELAMSMAEENSSRLEADFVVCYWDQRGAGMSYYSDIDPATMTVEQMIEDTKGMTNYLQQRFGQEKIYLLGHSWGSYLGVKTIEKYPEYYKAFLGVGQVCNQTESEKLAYYYMLEEAERIGDDKAKEQLLKFDPTEADFPPAEYIMGIRSSLMNKYGIGIMHENLSMPRLIKNMLFFKGYTLRDKVGYMRGMLFSQQYLFPSVTADNLFISSKQFEVPVYILQGKYDYQVSYALAKEYCEEIEAPDKEFYSFENSAHSPLWEEPEAFMQAMHEIITRVEQ